MPYEDSLSLRFRWVPLTKPVPMSRQLILQQARGQSPHLFPLLGNLQFHVLFHSPMGVLFIIPSQYYFAIGHPGVFSLVRWSLLIHTWFVLFKYSRPRSIGFSFQIGPKRKRKVGMPTGVYY